MLFTEVKLRMEKGERVLESWFMIMVEFMKANGKMIEDMEKDLSGTAMLILMKEISAEVKLMAMEFTNGKMGSSMKESG